MSEDKAKETMIMGHAPTVLIVDDSALARLILRNILPAHFQVVEAADGEEALAQFRKCQPDITFLDLILPKLDGVNLLRRIRETNRDAPVVVVSSNIQRAVKERLEEMGITAFIEKPVNRPEATEAILELLRQMPEDSSPLTLSAMQQDALVEALNVAVGKAAATLSELIDRPVELQVPDVGLYRAEEIETRLSGLLPGRASSVNQVFSGPFSGNALLVLPLELAQKLVRLVISRHGLENHVLESDLTTLLEVGNMVINGGLSAFGEMLESELTFSMPDVVVETLGSLMRSVMRRQRPMVKYIILVKTRFVIAEEGIDAYLILLIGVDSAELLLEALERITDRALAGR